VGRDELVPPLSWQAMRSPDNGATLKLLDDAALVGQARCLPDNSSSDSLSSVRSVPLGHDKIALVVIPLITKTDSEVRRVTLLEQFG
jgi:hypothetical protein